MQTSIKMETRCEATPSVIINGCTVSFKRTANGVAAPLETVKQILLSAYKTKSPQS